MFACMCCSHLIASHSRYRNNLARPPQSLDQKPFWRHVQRHAWNRHAVLAATGVLLRVVHHSVAHHRRWRGSPPASLTSDPPRQCLRDDPDLLQTDGVLLFRGRIPGGAGTLRRVQCLLGFRRDIGHRVPGLVCVVVVQNVAQLFSVVGRGPLAPVFGLWQSQFRQVGGPSAPVFRGFRSQPRRESNDELDRRPYGFRPRVHAGRAARMWQKRHRAGTCQQCEQRRGGGSAQSVRTLQPLDWGEQSVVTNLRALGMEARGHFYAAWEQEAALHARWSQPF